MKPYPTLTNHGVQFEHNHAAAVPVPAHFSHSTRSRTNAIGTGTVNMPINMPVDERTFWKKLAHGLRVASVGSLLRGLLARGLEKDSPELAERLHGIRHRYYGTHVKDALCNLGRHATHIIRDILEKAA